MASIVIRGLDARVKARLARQAKQHGRSMEAEAREILEVGTRASARNIAVALLRAARTNGGADDLRLPERADTARAVDFE